MNAITRYIRHAIDVSFRDRSEEEVLQALEYIYDNHTEAYFKQEYSYMMYDHRLPLATEIYNHGYYNIEWDDLDVYYFREYREAKYRKEHEEEQERDEQEELEDTTDEDS